MHTISVVPGRAPNAALFSFYRLQGEYIRAKRKSGRSVRLFGDAVARSSFSLGRMIDLLK